MIRKPYWSMAMAMLLALAFTTGCSSTPQTPLSPTLITITAVTPFQQNAVVGTPFTSVFNVNVTRNGTALSGASVTFTAPGTGAGGTFANGTNATGATTDANGNAASSAFSANGTVGTYVVVASAQGSTSTALFDLANTLQPQGMTVAGGSPQSVTASQQFGSTLSVTVKDPTGTKAVGANLPVTFTAPDGHFSDTDAVTTTALTNASGVATSAPYVASSTVGGLYTVTAATIDGDAQTATFTLSNTIQPAAITANTGTTPQSTPNGTPFAVPLSVTVVDGSTPPVPVTSAVVTFAAPAFTVDPVKGPSTASGTFADSGKVTTTAWTDSNGVATAAVFTANALAGGPYKVSATVIVGNGKNLSLNFLLTNQ